jgi:hypothetical protein
MGSQDGYPKVTFLRPDEVTDIYGRMPSKGMPVIPKYGPSIEVFAYQNASALQRRLYAVQICQSLAAECLLRVDEWEILMPFSECRVSRM